MAAAVVLLAASALAGTLHHQVIRRARSAGQGSERAAVFLTGAVHLFFLLSFLWGWRAWKQGNFSLYPAQVDGYRIAVWLAENTPEDSRVGVWNSGIVGYFSNRTVINMDGVVNNELYRYVSRKGVSFYDIEAIFPYMLQQEIDYMTDIGGDPFPIPDSIRAQLTIVHTFPSYSGTYPVPIYQLSPGGEAKP